MSEAVMKITDGVGSVFWLEGHDTEEAVESFGADITIEFYEATPVDPHLWADSLPIPKDTF